MTSFQELVWKATKRIPKGSVSTYKDIAQHLKCKAYRAVGNALHNNPHAPVVPCHRVVNSDGSIGGFARGAQEKVRMLQDEGVVICDGRIVGFEDRRFRF